MTDTPERAPRTAWTGWTPSAGFPLPGDGSSPDDRISFVLRLGRSLHTSGYAAHRLEEALALASERLGLTGQFFSTPTAMMASFGPQDDQRTFMIRVEPGESDLGKLAQVDEVTREVLNGTRTPLEGSQLLEKIEAAPPRYGRLLTTIAFGVVSGASARFLGGGGHEIVVATVSGLVIGGLALLTHRIEGLGRVFEPLAALVASMLATLAAALHYPVSVFLAALAGVIVLIPGLMLTTAMTELASRHLASGTARFMGALVLLLGIAFGIAFGAKIVALGLGVPPPRDPIPLPGWTLYLSLLLSPLAFVVLLKAEPRDAGWIVLSGVLAFGGASLGGKLFGSELGTFIGGFVVGWVSNWYARLTNRSSQIMLVPGLLLLVPGSIGVRSLASLLDRHVELGVEGAFKMVLIAVSLVSGILIANVVSPKRHLVVSR